MKARKIAIVDNTATVPLIELDLGDPISAPPGPYTVQPDVLGKFLLLTGGPGMGKSTTAQLLARNKGYKLKYLFLTFVDIRSFLMKGYGGLIKVSLPWAKGISLDLLIRHINVIGFVVPSHRLERKIEQ